MSTTAQIELWGTLIGAVTFDPEQGIARFQYDRNFLSSGIELSPLMMPLRRQGYRFPQLEKETFHGLPGLLADSVPDRFGNALIDAWLAAQGRSAESFNPVERLCYTGKRGMGALEFRPVLGPKPRVSEQLELNKLVELASEVLTHRAELATQFSNKEQGEALKEILRVGTSAGGARAKAVVAWNPDTNEVRSGQVNAPEGFGYWLLKFDGVRNNKDKELTDPQGFGAIEYAYHRMAVDAGIRMNPCHLLEQGELRHFMTRRFDRMTDGSKPHMQTLGAMQHFDFNIAGAYSYEQALLTIRQLGMGMDAIEEQFRRMAFNIIARNQDDHVKNIAFLMNKRGQWNLSPAYDITYSYNPQGDWTNQHQMALNGKRDNFALADFEACAATASMKRTRVKEILEDVRAVVRKWSDYAEAARVKTDWIKQVQANLRLKPFV